MFKTISIFLFCSFWHPVHVSVANIDYFKDRGELTISLKVDKNDMNLAIFHNYEDTLHLFEKQLDSIALRLSLQYLNNNLYIKINDSIKVDIIMKNYVFKEENIWFDFCGKTNARVEKMEVYNAIFTDLFFDQKNLVIFNGPGSQQGLYFDFQDRLKQLEWERE